MADFDATGDGGFISSGLAGLFEDLPVQELAPIQVDLMTFVVPFTSQREPPIDFRVFKDGVEIETFTSSTQEGQVSISVGPGDSPYVEILDKPCSIPSKAFPPRQTLNWRSIAGATSYDIQELDGTSWVLRQTQIDNGQGVFLFLSGVLEDRTVHDFRIVPIAENGTQGTPETYQVFMSRVPDIPDVSYSYDSTTGNLTIT